MSGRPVEIAVDETRKVSGLLLIPGQPFACLVLAHGAGAGMSHPFMTSVAEGLRDRGVATLRYQFPYMEIGSKRPDRPPLAHAAVRAAVATAHRLLPALPLIAGGKSFGARMTSQAQAAAPLPGVAGLVFLGFPFHPAGKPSDERAEHLFHVHVPMLFLWGTRDPLADPRIVAGTLARLAGKATSRRLEHADHSFHVPARSGRTDDQVLGEMLDLVADWTRDLC